MGAWEGPRPANGRVTSATAAPVGRDWEPQKPRHVASAVSGHPCNTPAGPTSPPWTTSSLGEPREGPRRTRSRVSGPGP